MDRSGFPFLSPTIFYYLVGKEDIAITLLEDVDVSGEALHVIKKVLITCIHVIHVQYLDESSDKLVDDEDDWKYIENSLEHCGSDLTLEVIQLNFYY